MFDTRLSTLKLPTRDQPASSHGIGHYSPVPVLDTAAFQIFDRVEDLENYVVQLRQGNLLVPFEYGRYGTETTAIVALHLLHLELTGKVASPKQFEKLFEANSPLVKHDVSLTSDGMRAVSAALTGVLFFHPDVTKRHHASKNPAHIIVGSDSYKQTRNIITEILEPAGVEVTVLDTKEFADKLPALLAKKPNTRAVFVEVPTNPFLRVANVDAIAATTRKEGVPLIVDATFATPFNYRPLTREFPANLVIHSATKYLNGFNNLSAGVVCGDRELIGAVNLAKGREGGQLSPQVASQLWEGMQTLNIRMPIVNQRGKDIAELLEKSSKVKKVWYPHLSSHPDYGHARDHLTGGGGVLSFELHGDFETTRKFLNSLEHFKIAASFGGIYPMIQPVALMSYSAFSPEARQRLGISDTLIRLSVGTTGRVEELLQDISIALRSL